MNRILFSLVAALLFIACNQEISNQDGDVFNASIEDITSKTILNQGKFVNWQAEDQVSIFNRNTGNKQYRVTNESAGQSSCTLEYVAGPAYGDALNHAVAFYPYANDLECTSSGSNKYILSNIQIQTVQTYTSESFAPGAFPMVAVSSTSNLSFKNICGAIKLQAKGDAKIASVTISGNQDEKLSGTASVIAQTSGYPTIAMGETAEAKVILDCGEGIQLNKDNVTEFILSVPPTEFAGGFKVIFEDTDSKKYTIDTIKNNKVERSSILVMPDITVNKADFREDNIGDDNDDTDTPSGPVVIEHEGLQYVWDESVIPEITMSVSLDEWNRLLAEYDANSQTKEYIHCDIKYVKGNEETNITNAAVRLRGNTSRRRPEAYQNNGKHVSNKADWQHCHFGINLRKYDKDKKHEIKGIRKMHLKWFKDDACYVRELFCYDLFRRAGIWTAAHDVYCRLWVHVEGDSKPAYYGVYEMIEPYDNKYLEKREHLFGTSNGHLWKCGWAQEPADLSNPYATIAEDNDKDDFTYELKEYDDENSSFELAKAQLQDFMLKLNGKAHGTPGDSFYKWIKQVCDVDLLMRTYAVNVAVGMWDDLWNNGNNYYLYFTTSHLTEYKVFLIPYDYDNTLGTSNAYDAAKQDPYNWGSRGVLIDRMMEYEEFRKIYRDELKRLVDPANGLMDTESSVTRIKAWQSKIQQYISNDTGEDMKIKDEPASWGSWGNYKLMDYNNNYFTVKAQTINKMK